MSALMVRTGARYRAADKHEVLLAAAQYMVREVRGDCLSTPNKTREFLKVALGARDSEAFCAVWLDSRHRLISFDVLFTGTINSSAVHPREVVKACLQRNAAAVILAHNHPSGLLEPSQADELITRRLREALALLDVRVLDHLIVSSDGIFSFAEAGLL